jgi:hypothetical protein
MKIKNPEHILLLFSAANLENPEEIGKALDLYRKCNPWFSKIDSESKLAAISRSSTLRCASRNVLYNWAVCREIQQLH